jgi:hypothetical protein
MPSHIRSYKAITSSLHNKITKNRGNTTHFLCKAYVPTMHNPQIDPIAIPRRCLQLIDLLASRLTLLTLSPWQLTFCLTCCLTCC